MAEEGGSPYLSGVCTPLLRDRAGRGLTEGSAAVERHKDLSSIPAVRR